MAGNGAQDRKNSAMYVVAGSCLLIAAAILVWFFVISPARSDAGAGATPSSPAASQLPSEGAAESANEGEEGESSPSGSVSPTTSQPSSAPIGRENGLAKPALTMSELIAGPIQVPDLCRDIETHSPGINTNMQFSKPAGADLYISDDPRYPESRCRIEVWTRTNIENTPVTAVLVRAAVPSFSEDMLVFYDANRNVAKSMSLMQRGSEQRAGGIIAGMPPYDGPVSYSKMEPISGGVRLYNDKVLVKGYDDNFEYDKASGSITSEMVVSNGSMVQRNAVLHVDGKDIPLTFANAPDYLLYY